MNEIVSAFNRKNVIINILTVLLIIMFKTFKYFILNLLIF